jgi:hypothetical protein
MSGTTDRSQTANVFRLDCHHPDPHAAIVSESNCEGEIARDPRETLIMKQNIDAYFRWSRKRA